LLYFILTTGKCNLHCRYCGGSFPEDKVPWTVDYDIELLKDLIKDDSDPTIAFYGGEPLENCGYIREVMNRVDVKRFIIQTNGLSAERLGSEYWNRMDAVLLSIDGTKSTTDFYRGEGVYRRVLRAAEVLRDGGFKGDLVARMAVSERSDIFTEVDHLLGLEIFDHIHWQIDAGWSEQWNDFTGWCERSYKPGILRLARKWLSEMEDGKVLGLVPFLGIRNRLRRGGPIPPCGSGEESISVMPDGSIRACPIAFDVKWALLGRLPEHSGSKLPKVHISGQCMGCSYLRVCGGRCLYFNRERLWGQEGFEKVCEITKYTIDIIAAMENPINQVVARGTVDQESLDYPKFNNTTEIIP
jgi:putative peptide-modifying radical SAM enzyme